MLGYCAPVLLLWSISDKSEHETRDSGLKVQQLRRFWDNLNARHLLEHCAGLRFEHLPLLRSYQLFGPF